MSEHKPFKVFPRRLPYALREELEVELDQLLHVGCIERSCSPYASGLVLVRKKDGGLRVCVDYRGINRNTVPDRYPLPRVDELIDTVGKQKGKFFTSLDLMKGYHQIRVADCDKPKTAFICHRGLFQYRRMPFGLTNAPATFQRLMGKLFGGKEWDFLFVYLNDLLIVSRTLDEHKRHIRKVLHRLEEANLRLKPQKCFFAQTRIEYLGHTVTSEGVLPNSNKVKAILEYPRPTSIKEARSFLGLVNYYRRQICNLAAVSRPLTALTRKDKANGLMVPFGWSEECEFTFIKIKQLLTSAPILRPPDLTKEFYLWTDASSKGFGAVLEQQGDDGKRYPVAFASRQTNLAEQKYAPTELEVAALIFAVEHFEVYLIGSTTTVYTDHQALVSSFLSYMKSQTRGLLARWYLRISRFLPLLRIEYKPGSANCVADALSRSPVPVEEVNTGNVLQITLAEDQTMSQVETQQRQDPELLKIIECLEKRTDLTDPNKVPALEEKGYLLVDGVLYYESSRSPRRRLVVPKHLRKLLLSEHHDTHFAGHFGTKKLVGRLAQYYYWTGMGSDAHKKCESCVTCASVQGQGRKERPPLKSIRVGGAFECVGMDFKEMDMSKAGNKYVLVIQDYLTKWPEVYAVPDRKAETVAKCWMDFIWKHGVPNRIIHDRAAEFLSEVLQETARLVGVSQLPTSGGTLRLMDWWSD